MSLLPFRSESPARTIPATESEFGEFWRTYPRHIGKLAAIKAYAKARTLASAEEIQRGVERYKANKPAYADWCHPSTFLNEGRWMDEPDEPPQRYGEEDWRCHCVPPCVNSQWHRVAMAKKRGEA